MLQYTGLYHPHVENAIANALELGDDQRILFLTGANMAGKSTLMKSLGIALYLAHMGFPVAAAQLGFAVLDGIYTSINLSDNLSAGASHYYAEVLRVKEVTQSLHAGNRLFVVFDELFRGTNVKDAHDATIAVTRGFAHRAGSRFIISTHIMEAAEKLQEEDLPISYQYLPTEMDGNIPVYTRVLFGGGRNLDIQGETTTEFGTTSQIQGQLEAYLQTMILPSRSVEIEHRWSGIMGMGSQRSPIVQALSSNVFCGVRLSGTGVAIGSLVGEELAASGLAE